MKENFKSPRDKSTAEIILEQRGQEAIAAMKKVERRFDSLANLEIQTGQAGNLARLTQRKDLDEYGGALLQALRVGGSAADEAAELFNGFIACHRGDETIRDLGLALEKARNQFYVSFYGDGEEEKTSSGE